MTEFLALVSGGHSDSHLLEACVTIVLHDTLSPAPDVATGASLRNNTLSPARTLPCQSAVLGVDGF